MSIFAVRSGFAVLAVAFCLGAQPAHAQSAPIQYWTPGWLGFGGNLYTGQDANTDSGSTGFSTTRFNFENGFFVGNQRSPMGFSGLNQSSAFGSYYSEGVQFGYNFKNAPVTFFGGVDTLKYNSGLGGAFSSPFDSVTSTPGYRVNAGVEFRPTSNLSLSLGASYVEQGGRLNADTKSPSLSNTSQFDLVGGRR